MRCQSDLESEWLNNQNRIAFKQMMPSQSNLEEVNNAQNQKA